jgi:peptide subunit release factor 1 (eRF1)
MISRRDLHELLSHPLDTESPILSVYLDVDQQRAINLNRGFEAVLKSMIRELEHGLGSSSKLKEFLSDARLAGSFVSDYQPAGKGLVLFCDASKEFTWHRSLNISLGSSVHWMMRAYVRPVVEARDEFERYGIILTDRARARLFSIYLGSIEEHHEALAEADVHKSDATGMDQMYSQKRFQRKADEHARWHLKNVAEMADRFATTRRFDRLILGGTHEITSELRNLLPERLKQRLVGFVTLPIDAGTSEILEETKLLEQTIERKEEEALVRRLSTAAAKDNQAVVGLGGVLTALNLGRIRRLVYSNGFDKGGCECQECGGVFEGGAEECRDCGGSQIECQDILNAVIGRVVREGGDIEQVRGNSAARLLKDAGGIGAYLRF